MNRLKRSFNFLLGHTHTFETVLRSTLLRNPTMEVKSSADLYRLISVFQAVEAGTVVTAMESRQYNLTEIDDFFLAK